MSSREQAEERPPAFATPLPQSPRSDVLEWRLPRPFRHYVLTGRSRAAWHTSFVVPQLGLVLDTGLCVNRLRPKHVFLTHGHSDHTLLAPAFVGRDDPPDVFCPAEMADAFDDFILASTVLDLGGRGGRGGDDDGGREPRSRDAAPVRADRGREGGGGVAGGGGGEEAKERANPGGVANGENHEPGDRPGRRHRSPREQQLLETHTTHGLRPGDVVPLRRLKERVTATAFACDHSVPCLGYVFALTTDRLRPELASLAAPDLQALRRAGAALTRPRRVPILAFLGDTTAATLAAAPDWLRDGIPVVVTECSFLYPDHKPLADKTKHTAWCDLEPVVRRWPETVFVLIHFSLRYSDADVAAFFQRLADPPRNIVVWADPGP
ncbi:hypothetical protein CDD83_8239 [Cordyceps sp. RAO-2017]|nr:hypothetical protein CDD83_8239 [Cordyceps sp. RAO-2017]